ncbi:hypothetical protein IWQ60_005072 [Tieghemiomyces parasiticus]|uniref:Cyclin N-terminal domain-containing protein n=1 Tax=Tieghemiomyces parasiticus TaxID=78921 RepID=A0A9W8DYS5_9FUNG|nr:hypothetical protein IWQ60_005072 [Tieghemiomyces parasiticus]
MSDEDRAPLGPFETQTRAPDFILKAAGCLELSAPATYRALVYYHRFRLAAPQPALMTDPPGSLDARMVALACVLLASTASEELRSSRDVVNVGHSLAHPAAPVLPAGDLAERLQATVDALELVCLRVLRFDLAVDLPHPWVRYVCEGQYEVYPGFAARATALEAAD